MMDRVEFLKKLFDYLNQQIPCALLRNFEGLPEQNDSRDIDIAIAHKDYLRHCCELMQLVEEAGWKIVTYLNSDRLSDLYAEGKYIIVLPEVLYLYRKSEGLSSSHFNMIIKMEYVKVNLRRRRRGGWKKCRSATTIIRFQT